MTEAKAKLSSRDCMPAAEIQTCRIPQRRPIARRKRTSMTPNVSGWFSLPHTNDSYQQLAPLVLVNGLAEQSESWFANRAELSQAIRPEGARDPGLRRRTLHDRIDSGGEITIDYLADRLARFLDEYVQRPPYYLVGSSLGCQVILTYATRQPRKRVETRVDLSFGLSGELKTCRSIEGVSRSNYDEPGRIGISPRAGSPAPSSCRHSPQIPGSQDGRKEYLRTLRGTLGHSVAHSCRWLRIRPW